MKPAAIFLFDVSGIAALPWSLAGIECWCVDVQHSIRVPRTEGNIHFVYGDVRTWRPPSDRRIVFVASMSPCTDVAVSGARDFVAKGGGAYRDAIELFDAGRQAAHWSGAPYYCENSVGVLSSVPHIGKPDFYFHPWEYAGWHEADHYTKKTCLWTGNGFVMPPKRPALRLAGVKPDDRIHKASPSDERGNVRSASPLGFNRAVFQANCPVELRLAA